MNDTKYIVLTKLSKKPQIRYDIAKSGQISMEELCLDVMIADTSL